MSLIAAIVFSKASLVISLLGQGITSGDSMAYQKVISCEGLSKATLQAELNETVYQLYDSTAITLSEETLRITMDFTVQNQLIGTVGNPAGLLQFVFDIEVKNEKFRYSAYSFYFTPMERDRYGRFRLTDQNPELVSDENFEKKRSLLKKIKKQTNAYLQVLEAKLKDEVMRQSEKETEW